MKKLETLKSLLSDAIFIEDWHTAHNIKKEIENLSK